MFLTFNKITENENLVSYWIFTDYWDESYLPEIKWIPIKGCCLFDKNTKEISFDPAKTDHHFFELKNEILMIKAHLLKIDKKQKVFPETYSIVTG